MVMTITLCSLRERTEVQHIASPPLSLALRRAAVKLRVNRVTITIAYRYRRGYIYVTTGLTAFTA